MNGNIYIATYSNVDVYECIIDDVPLMRRVSDDWINATQILKAAKFPKAHRTRILDKETQTCVHEKIQGGYGRFQGTWVPLDVARSFAHRHNITDEMAPILIYNKDVHGPLEKKTKTKPSGTSTPQQNQNDGSPSKKPRKVYNTKKRRAAAAAAALENSKVETDDSMNLSTSGVWENSEASQADSHSHLPPHLARQQVPQPPAQPQFHYTANRQSYPGQPETQSQQLQYSTQFQQQVPPQQHQQQHPQIQHQHQQHQHQHPPQHQSQQQQQQQPGVQYPAQYYPYQQHTSRGSNENWSQDEASTHMDDVRSDTSISSEHSYGVNDSKAVSSQAYTEALIRFFSNESEEIPENLLHPPRDFDFNAPIDDEGHTPLHWASSMASVPLIALLLKDGSDPLTPNYNGLNAVSRSIFFNNAYQKKNFHLIVDLMKPSLYTPDKAGRTPVHYICESNASKSHISMYYLQTVLNKLSSENSNIVKMVVEHKDASGLTASDLAQKTKNHSLLSILDSVRSGVDESRDQDMNPESEITEDVKTDSEHDPPPLPTLPLAEAGPILTSMLGSLADAYDNELKSKEEESQHTESILEKLQVDIDITEKRNKVILNQLDIGSTFEELEENITDLEDICTKKTSHLNKIIERGQALGLAKLVLKEESSIKEEQTQESQQALAVKLTALQFQRNQMVKNIIQEFLGQNINTKMNNFRRLISISCGLKIENIDDLIDEIEADLFTTVS